MESATSPQEAVPRGPPMVNTWAPQPTPSGPPSAAQGPAYSGPPFPPPGQPRPFGPPAVFPQVMGQPGGRPYPPPPGAPGFGPRGPPPGPPPRGPPVASGTTQISRPPPPSTYPPGTRPPPMMTPSAGGAPPAGQKMMPLGSARQPPPPPPRLGPPGPPPRPVVGNGPPGVPPPRAPFRPPANMSPHTSTGPPGVSPPGVSDQQALPSSTGQAAAFPPYSAGPGQQPPGIQVQGQGMPAPSVNSPQQMPPGQAKAFGNFPSPQSAVLSGAQPLLHPGAPPLFPPGPRMRGPGPVSQVGLLGPGQGAVNANWPAFPQGIRPSAPDSGTAVVSSETPSDGNAGAWASSTKSGDASSPGRLVAPGTEPEVPGGEKEVTDAEKAEEKNAEEGSGKSEVDEAWTAHKSEDGVLYYYNSITAESTYDRPKGFKGKPEKVAAQPTPIAWERITSTDWALVTTDDGKKYYYNTKNQDTSWQIPPEVIAARYKLHEELKKNGSDPHGKDGVSFSLTKGGSGAAASALDLIKKKLGESVVYQMVASDVQGVDNGGPHDGGAAEAISAKEKEQEGGGSSDSDDDSEDEVQESAEERAAAFKEMLKERGVAPFSKWEKELPRIFHDERFKAIASHMERKALFEQYVKKRADEQRKEKRAAQKAALENFKALLDETSDHIDHSTTPETFAKKCSTDARYKGLDRKERDLLLNERVAPLRKAEEERMKAQHEVAVTDFKKLLKETSDIDGHSRWSKVKETLRDDPRFQALGRDYREDIFEAHVAALRVEEEEAERQAKIKREEEERQKAKEREVRKRKEREQQELDRQKLKQRRLDAATNFQALLTDVVEDPQVSWGEMKIELAKDPRGSNADLLPEDCEKMFLDHVDKLLETCTKEFRQLLLDLITPDAVKSHRGKNVLNSWTEAKKLLKSDPRYERMPRRQREELWVRHADEVERKVKAGREKDGSGHTSKKSPSRRSPSRKSSGRKSSPSRRSSPRRSPQPSSRHAHRSRSVSPRRSSPSSRHGHGASRR